MGKEVVTGITKYQNGMTVAELKLLISYWPEVDENGEPCEVWISNGAGLSSQARESCALNLRENALGNKIWADLMLST